MPWSWNGSWDGYPFHLVIKALVLVRNILTQSKYAIGEAFVSTEWAGRGNVSGRGFYRSYNIESNGLQKLRVATGEKGNGKEHRHDYIL